VIHSSGDQSNAAGFAQFNAVLTQDAQRIMVLFAQMVATRFMTKFVDHQPINFLRDSLLEESMAQAKEIEMQITARRIAGEKSVRGIDESDGIRS
jgi:hypothetical protein